MDINALRHFIDENPGVKSNRLTASEIYKEIIKPKTLATNQSCVHRYVGISDPKTEIPYTSSATVCVSPAWKYEFYYMVATVMEQHAMHAYYYYYGGVRTSSGDKANHRRRGSLAHPWRLGHRQGRSGAGTCATVPVGDKVRFG